ncbi:MAG: 5-methylcytosine restriction system specificity protein McrC [Campylobacterales bacterium]
MFEDGSREIRPDIIIEKDAKTVAVLDAKYKWYKQIGKNGNSDYSVSRDDLYQMTTYLYHYGKENLNIVGLFISPIEQSIEAPKVLKNNLKHKIKVVNLDIEQFKKPYNTEGVPTDFSIDKIKSEEKNFIKNIEGILNDPI